MALLCSLGVAGEDPPSRLRSTWGRLGRGYRQRISCARAGPSAVWGPPAGARRAEATCPPGRAPPARRSRRPARPPGRRALGRRPSGIRGRLAPGLRPRPPPRGRYGTDRDERQRVSHPRRAGGDRPRAVRAARYPGGAVLPGRPAGRGGGRRRRSASALDRPTARRYCRPAGRAHGGVAARGASPASDRAPERHLTRARRARRADSRARTAARRRAVPGSVCANSRSSPSTARGGRRRRSTPTARHDARSSTSLVSSPARRCRSSNGRSCGRIPHSSARGVRPFPRRSCPCRPRLSSAAGSSLPRSRR